MDRRAVSPHIECLHLPAQARYQNPAVGPASNLKTRSGDFEFKAVIRSASPPSACSICASSTGKVKYPITLTR